MYQYQGKTYNYKGIKALIQQRANAEMVKALREYLNKNESATITAERVYSFECARFDKIWREEVREV